MKGAPTALVFGALALVAVPSAAQDSVPTATAPTATPVPQQPMTPAVATPEPAAVRRIAVAPVHAVQAVTDQIAATLSSSSLQQVHPDVASAALSEAGAPFPPRAVDLWWLTRRTGADFALAATLRIEDEAYVLTLWIAARSGNGPYSTVIEADAPSLRPSLDARLREELAKAEAADGAPAPSTAPAPRSDTAAPTPGDEPFKRIRLAGQTEAAIGLTGHGFYNHLFGGRFDYRFVRSVSFGGYLGYVNLKGKDGRAHNVLPLAHIEYRAGLDRADTVELAFRYAAGYLPANGPLMRLSGGLAFHVGDDVDILVDLIAPTFWLTKDLPVVSANFAAEVGYTP
jgi:hypothetical protein